MSKLGLIPALVLTSMYITFSLSPLPLVYSTFLPTNKILNTTTNVSNVKSYSNNSLISTTPSKSKLLLPEQIKNEKPAQLSTANKISLVENKKKQQPKSDNNDDDDHNNNQSIKPTDVEEAATRRRHAYDSPSVSLPTLSSIYNYINKNQKQTGQSTTATTTLPLLRRLPRFHTQQQFSSPLPQHQHQHHHHHDLYKSQQSVALGLNENDVTSGSKQYTNMRPAAQVDDSAAQHQFDQVNDLIAQSKLMMSKGAAAAAAVGENIYQKAPQISDEQRLLADMYLNSNQNNMENVAGLSQAPVEFSGQEFVGPTTSATATAHHDNDMSNFGQHFTGGSSSRLTASGNHELFEPDQAHQVTLRQQLQQNFYPVIHQPSSPSSSQPIKQHGQHQLIHQQQQHRFPGEEASINSRLQKHLASQTNKRGTIALVDSSAMNAGAVGPKHSKLLETRVLSPGKKQQQQQPAKKSMLSNDQLITLIDELKQYNDQQASKSLLAAKGVLVAPTNNRRIQPLSQQNHQQHQQQQQHPNFKDADENYLKSNTLTSRAKETQNGNFQLAKNTPKYNKQKSSEDTSENDDQKSNSNGDDVEEDDQEQADDASTKQKPPQPAPSSETTNEPASKGKMSASDLKRLADFLMTKEGDNMKFQLGLEKESPDDGDQDDYKDALLESKKKQRKTKLKKPSKSGLEDLDLRHKEASLQMDRLLDGANDKTRHVERSLKRKNANAIRENQQTPGDDESRKKARKRRDHSIITHNHTTSKEVITKIPTPPKPSINQQQQQQQQHNKKREKLLSPGGGGGDETNFAKMLIKQEILEDQKEALSDPPTLDTVEKSSSNQKKQPKEKEKNKSSTTNKQTVGEKKHLSKGLSPDDSFAETSLPATVGNEEASATATSGAVGVGGDDEEDDYSNKDKNVDQNELVKELKKTRNIKSKTRSRLGMPLDGALKRALDGDMGIRTERLADGKLVLKEGDKGKSIMSLELPTSSKTTTNVIESNSSGDGSADSELSPRQAEPRKNQDQGSQTLDSVKVQSSKALQDEYPISDKVSDRLNKLSTNLDRYFNDGFMQEVEQKAKLEADSHQTQPSNVNEAAKIANEITVGSAGKSAAVAKIPGKRRKSSGGRKKEKEDTDFDIDVGVDGKRDKDDLDVEKSYEQEKDEVKDTDDDDDGDNKNNNNNKNNRKLRVIRRRVGGGGKKEREEIFDDSIPGPIKESVGGSSVSGLGIKIMKKPSMENKQVSRDETSTSEKVEFEKLGTFVPSASIVEDPVESESLETPIGPDVLDKDKAELASSTKTKSTKGTNVSTSYGKKPEGKFFEEPEW